MRSHYKFIFLQSESEGPQAAEDSEWLKSDEKAVSQADGQSQRSLI